MKKNPVLFVCIVLLFGCKSPGENIYLEELPYFDLAGLVDRQIILMDSLKPEVVKNAIYEGKNETTRIKPDSTQWANLLELFKEADINKPVLRGLYQEKSGLKDPSSNLKVKMYEAEKPEEVNVKYLKIYYLKQPEDTRKIEVRVEENNPLFKGIRELKMELIEDGEGTLLLDSYTIEGTQKMILLDSVSFRIKANVIL